MAFTDVLKNVKYLPNFLAIASIWKQANDDNIPGFSLNQAKSLIDDAYPLTPSNVRTKATQPEVLAAFLAIEALIAPIKAIVPLAKKAIDAVKALFV
jgi:hypothetical protein